MRRSRCSLMLLSLYVRLRTDFASWPRGVLPLEAVYLIAFSCRVTLMNSIHFSRSGTFSDRPSRLAMGSMACSPSSGLVKPPSPKPASSGISILDLMWPVYGRTRVIRVGRTLERKNHRDFNLAYANSSTEVKVYVVDFLKTAWIDESVLGMLLMLRKHVGNDRERIHLMHTGYRIRKTLDTINLNAFFTTDANTEASDSYSQLLADTGFATTTMKH